MFGVSDGFACIINATDPVTTGAAMLVPLKLRYGLYEVERDPLNRYDAFDV
jgi:hypothetical protein